MSVAETDESNSKTPNNNWNPQNAFVVDIFFFFSIPFCMIAMSSGGQSRRAACTANQKRNNCSCGRRHERW